MRIRWQHNLAAFSKQYSPANSRSPHWTRGVETVPKDGIRQGRRTSLLTLGTRGARMFERGDSQTSLRGLREVIPSSPGWMPRIERFPFSCRRNSRRATCSTADPGSFVVSLDESTLSRYRAPGHGPVLVHGSKSFRQLRKSRLRRLGSEARRFRARDGVARRCCEPLSAPAGSPYPSASRKATACFATAALTLRVFARSCIVQCGVPLVSFRKLKTSTGSGKGAVALSRRGRSLSLAVEIDPPDFEVVVSDCRPLAAGTG